MKPIHNHVFYIMNYMCFVKELKLKPIHNNAGL